MEKELYLGFMLYKQEKVSIGRAAEVSGLDIYDFMKECSKNQIPVINISKEELQDEFEGLELFL